jgi:hypothetical protein
MSASARCGTGTCLRAAVGPLTGRALQLAGGATRHVCVYSGSEKRAAESSLMWTGPSWWRFFHRGAWRGLKPCLSSMGCGAVVDGACSWW